MKIKQEILNRSITHEQHMQEVLKDDEYQKDYLVKLNGLLGSHTEKMAMRFPFGRS